MRRSFRAALAAALLLLAVPVAAGPDSREERARALVEEARTRFAEGTFEQHRIAIRLLEEAAQLQPKRSETVEALGRAYLDAGYNHRARVTFEHAMHADPKNPEPPFGLALLYKRNWLRSLAKEDFDLALKFSGAALRLAPEHCEAAVLHAMLQSERGDGPEAGLTVTRAFAAGCDSPELLMAASYLYFRSGDAVRAESVLAVARPSLSPSLSARFDAVAPMLDGVETEALEAMDPGARDSCERRFWSLADPDPTTSLNEALLEYHARVAHATLLLNDRWNPRWDMRAALYVRFGAPAHVTFNPAGLPDSYRLNPNQVFWGGSDGRSVREITEPMFLPMNVQIWEYPNLGMVVEVRDLVLSQNYEMPRTPDHVAEALVDSQVAERHGLVMAAGGRAAFSPLLPGVRRLDMATRVAHFAGVAGPHVLAQLEVPGSPADSLTAEFVVLDSTGSGVARISARLSPSNCDPAELRTADFAFDVPPGNYRLAFSVSDVHGGRGVARVTEVVGAVAPGLSISDLVPVCGPFDAAVSGGAVRIAPNVTARVVEGAPLYAYFEVYHLRTGEDGRSRFDYVYEVHALGPSVRPWYQRWLPDRPHARLSVRSEESSSGPLRRQFLQVPVQDLPPGEYRLDVVVHDLLGDSSATQSLVFAK